jgi:hypothetical protein
MLVFNEMQLVELRRLFGIKLGFRVTLRQDV